LATAYQYAEGLFRLPGLKKVCKQPFEAMKASKSVE
jgi:hypothetical protein